MDGLGIIGSMGFTIERWRILRRLAQTNTLTELEDCIAALSKEDEEFLRVWIALAREDFCQVLNDWNLE